GLSHPPQQLKFTPCDSCDHIKDAFQLLLARYYGLKLELDKLANKQQILGTIHSAKQVTTPELNSIIQQQLQAHQLSQLQALALALLLTPLSVGLQLASLPAVSRDTGLLSPSTLGSEAHLSKKDKNGPDGDNQQEDDDDKSD
ncbi:hypothetical protein MC885_002548, partial [Smutsia gigantea]